MSATQVQLDLRHELAAIVGEKNVIGSGTPVDAALETYSVDGIVPCMTVAPENAEQTAAVLKLASENDLVVVPRGGGTQLTAGHAPERIDVLLDTTRMASLHHYDAGDLTLSVGAGMTIARLQQILAEHGQFLPLDPPQPEHATVGGTLAANICGPLSAGYGSTRDFCIGMEFVTGNGVMARGGGRVVKNVAGYDLMKLLIGSHGTLGVITSANFKVFPRPKQTRTYECAFSSADSLTAFLLQSSKLPFTPMAMEAVSPMGMEYLAGPVTARNPDEYAPSGKLKIESEWHIYLRAAGSDAVLARVKRELGNAVQREFNGANEEGLWRRLSAWQTTITERHKTAMLAHMCFPASCAMAALTAAEDCAIENNLLFATAGRPRAGNMMAAFLPLTTDPASSMQYANTISALRALLPAECGVSVVRSPAEAKPRFDLWGASQADMELMRGVRCAMDPKLVLNRGRYIV